MIFIGVALADEVARVQVRDKARGDPIPGATVDGVPVDGRGVATVTLAGPGPWTVTAAADGYTTASKTLDVAGDVKIWLAAGGGPIEVVVEGLKAVADPSRHVVDGEMALETPGTLDDSLRLVQALPGVTVQREYSPGSGELSVRGSGAGDSRYYLDGIEVPYLYHYNQYASVFPATQVDQLELFPSTFSARYGDAVGAILEAESKRAAPEAIHGGGSLNFVMAGADVTAPIGGGWWFAASGRRSYQDLAGEGSAQYTVWPTFFDYALRVERGDEDNGTGVFAFGAGDAYTRAAGELDLLDPVEAAAIPYYAYRQGFQVLGARRHWSAEAWRGRLVAGLVHHGRGGDLSGIGSEDLDTLTLSSRLDASSVGDGLGWDVGYELLGSRTSLVVEDAGPLGVRVAEEAPALARGVSLDEDALRLRGGVYGTGRADLGPVRVLPGVRVSGDTTGRAQLEPRASTRWTVSEGLMVKVGAGRYAQRPEVELLFAAPDLPATTSWQVSGGFESAIAGRLEISVDAYRKWLTDPLLAPIDAPPFAVPKGQAWGAELVGRYRLRERFFAWGWFAVQRTTLTDADGEVFSGDGDQRLSGGVVLSYDLGRVTLGGRYRYASGLPYTNLTGSVYDGGNDQWLPISGPINGARLPPYHKVDARVAYEWQLRGWSLEATAEIWYVPPSSAQLYPTWNHDYTEQGFVTGPTLLPLLGVRARF